MSISGIHRVETVCPLCCGLTVILLNALCKEMPQTGKENGLN